MDWMPQDPWVPCTAPLTSGTALRSASLLRHVVAQFRVQDALRYRAHDGLTFCNIFVWDVTRALGCEVPHWSAGRELRANEMAAWLEKDGPRHGWRPCSVTEAAERANLGHVSVGVWRNPDRHQPGHITLVVPSEGGLSFAQAGARNFASGPYEAAFPHGKEPKLFTHD